MQKIKLTGTLSILLFISAALYSQHAHNHSSICGSDHHPTHRLNKVEIDYAIKNGKSIITDRFGNTYLEKNIRIEKLTNTENDTESLTNTCDAGHFTLYFENGWSINSEDEPMKNLVCQVFNDLSNILEASATNPQINIRINKEILGGGALGKGTPYWNINIPDLTKKIGNFIIPDILAGHAHEGSNGFHGQLIIASQVDWFIDDTPLTTDDMQNDKKDLYTVVLHEALHILGFASRINENGNALPLNETSSYSFYSEWDKYLYHNGTPLIATLEGSTNEYEYCIEYNYTHGLSPQNILTGNCNELEFEYNGSYYEVINTESIGDIYNSLSHFNIDCGGEDYVMHPSLSDGETRRNITEKEKEALCNIGYNITGTCISLDEYCFVSITDDFIIIEPGGSYTLTVDEILSNDLLEGIIEDPILETTCGDISGLSISGTTGPLDIVANIEGEYSFCYTITSCDGSCYDGLVNILVKPTNFNQFRKCNQLQGCQVFFDDFNYPNVDLGQGTIAQSNKSDWNYYTSRSITWPSDEYTTPYFFDTEMGEEYGNSADLKVNNFNYILTDECETLGSFQMTGGKVHMGARFNYTNNNLHWAEGICVPICTPIYPGDYAEVRFSAANTQYCFFDHTIVDVGFTNQDVESNQDINNLIEIHNEIELENSGITPNGVDFIEKTALFDNAGQNTWDYVFFHNILSNYFETQTNGLSGSHVYLDYLEVSRYRDIQIQGETFVDACHGEIEIQYEITDYRSDFDINISGLPTGVTLIPTPTVPSMSFTVTSHETTFHEENETYSTILTVRLAIPDSYPLGSSFDLLFNTHDPTGVSCGTLDNFTTTTVNITEQLLSIDGVFDALNNQISVNICNNSTQIMNVDLDIEIPMYFEIQTPSPFQISQNNVGGTLLSTEGIVLQPGLDQCQSFIINTITQGEPDCDDFLVFKASSNLSCEDVIDIEDSYCLTDGNPLISGFIEDPCENNILVGGVNILVNASGELCNTTTNPNGYYDCGAIGDDNLIYASSDHLTIDPRCGVTTYDIVLIQKHILGVQPLNDPYRHIAADVNSSNDITTLDAVLVRRIILGIDQAWPSDDEYKFINKASVAPFLNDPTDVLSNYHEFININSYAPPYDFMAIKLGDANCSSGWNLCNEDFLNGNISLLPSFNASSYNTGDLVEVTFSLGQELLLDGFQLGIRFDKNQIQNIELKGEELSSFSADNYNFKDDENIKETTFQLQSSSIKGDKEAISFQPIKIEKPQYQNILISWVGDVQQGNLIKNQNSLLTLKFIAQKNITDVSQLLSLENNDIQNMLIDHNGNILEPTLVNAKSISSKESLENPQNLYVFPNPSQGIVNISGINIERVEVYNSNGQLITNEYKTNQISMNQAPEGLYFIKIINTKGDITIQKVLLSKK